MADSPFRFDARVDAQASVWPMPTVSQPAKDLLFAMLNFALKASPRLKRLDHTMKVSVGESQQVEASVRELLRVRFPLPCEGTDHPVPTLDYAKLEAGELHFGLGSMYATHLVFLGLAGGPLVGADDVEFLRLEDGDRSVLVRALQHFDVSMNQLFNFAVVEAALSKRAPPSPATFGMYDARRLLRRLGAQPGGAGC